MLETLLIIYFGIALIVFVYAVFRAKQPWHDALADALAWPIHLLTADALSDDDDVWDDD